MGQKTPTTPVFSPLIFDTDVAIWIFRRHPEALSFARSVAATERNISVVSHLELLRGCRGKSEVKSLIEFAEDWFTEIVPLTAEVSSRATTLMKEFAASRRPGVDDILIGATALVRNEMVATGNVRHFHFIPGLKIKPFRA